MIRCIVSDTETEPSCSNYLTREKGFELLTISSENEILECYKFFRPDVVILDLDNSTLNYKEIIEQLTHLFADVSVSNIILLYTNFYSLLNINISKVFMFLHKPFSEDILICSIKKVIEERNEKRFLKDELHKKVFLLQNKMNIPDITSGTIYLRKAVRCCFRNPDSANRLNDVYQQIANRHNISIKQVEGDIRNTLTYYKDFYPQNKTTLQELFGANFSQDDLTPKRVIRYMASYLRLHYDEM